jgi:hypothetical protein
MPLTFKKIEPQKSIEFYVKGKLRNPIYNNSQHKFKNSLHLEILPPHNQ